MMKQTINSLLIACVLFLLSIAHGLPASDQIPAKPQERPIALVGGTIHTVSGDVIERGTVLFIDGKITAVGINIALPNGVEAIDVAGKHVYPGMIAATTNIGLVEIGAVRASRDYAELGDINPNVRAEAAINPDSEIIPVTRANGITMALSVPSGGLITGTSALIMLDGWTWESMTFKAPVGLHIRWPFMGVRRSRFIRTSPKDQLKRRDESLNKIKTAFAEARAYLKAKEAEVRKGIPYHETDLRWEALGRAINKEIPVFIFADGIRQIQAAVDWAVSEDLDMVLVGGRDAWRAVELLKRHNIPVIVGGTLTTPMRRWEAYDTAFKNPLRLHEAGVQYCIAGTGGVSGGASNARNLPYNAAMSAAYGLPKEEALKAVTLYPAQILGVADRVGSIEVGKDATLIVTDGDPLEIVTQIEREFILGRKIDLSSRHTQLYEKYKTKYERLGLTGGK